MYFSSLNENSGKLKTTRNSMSKGYKLMGNSICIIHVFSSHLPIFLYFENYVLNIKIHLKKLGDM